MFMKEEHNEEVKELSLQSGKFLGELQQALIDALNKRADEIFEADGNDRSYWQFNITLEMEEMDSTFTKPLRTTTIESKNV